MKKINLFTLFNPGCQVEVIFYGCSDTKTENHTVHATGTKHVFKPAADSTLRDETLAQQYPLIDLPQNYNQSEVLQWSYLNGIHVYPVPACESVNVDFNSLLCKEIRLIDPAGQLIFSTNSSPGNHIQLHISDLTAGMYFLKVLYHDGRTFIKKVLKQ